MISAPQPVPVEYRHRPLTRPEAEALHRELKTTPNILGYTVRELVRARDVWVATAGADGAFAGVMLSLDMPLGWTELAALYVLPEYRGRGIARELFDRAWERGASRRRHLYALSRNKQVQEMMRRRGMVLDGALWRAPLAVHLFMPLYMSSPYRNVEAFRKAKSMRETAPLLQGIWRNPDAGPGARRR